VRDVEIGKLHIDDGTGTVSAGSMYRFLLTPKWLAFHLLVLVGIVTMVNLGLWQLRRLDERQERNAAVASRVDLPPAPLDEVLVDGADPDDLRWRPVTASGRYLPDEQLVVVNRSQHGLAGEIVVTPLHLEDGRVLLVSRGFVPLDQPVAAAPTGDVVVTGRLQPSQERRTGGLSDAPTGDLAEAQRVDIERLTPQLPGDVVPMYVELTSSQPPEATPYPEPLTLPDLTDGPHLSYAVQWFIFAIAVAVGWVLAVRKSISTRRAAARRAAAGAAPEAVDATTSSSSG
jgi:cytochrome oxidase assembly protein ShyY1